MVEQARAELDVDAVRSVGEQIGPQNADIVAKVPNCPAPIFLL
jgi:hypothetical protein